MENSPKDEWWASEFSPAKSGRIDFLSKDGSTAVEVQQSSHGSRGLYSAVMQAAIFLELNPNVEQACLVLLDTRMSLERLKDEWKASTNALRSRIAQRLAVAVIENEGTWLFPDEPHIRRIARHFERDTAKEDQDRWVSVKKQPGRKSHEIVKVLINRWLTRQGPIALGKLSEVVGCSHPIIQKTLDQPSLRRFLTFTTSRSVELSTFPHDLWQEVVVRSKTLRNSIRFRDRSGTKPTPQSLLKRLVRNMPPNLAVGGVISARHWHPDFDLHGTPRLDLVYHAPTGKVDLDFVKRIDPALAQVGDPLDSAVLVVHPLVRKSSSFIDQQKEGIPWADPVETALDLYDMSLTMQANQMLTYLRREVRLT